MPTGSCSPTAAHRPPARANSERPALGSQREGSGAFPSVLDNMNKNLDWTTQLGNAYYNQPQDVMNAVQGLRQQA